MKWLAAAVGCSFMAPRRCKWNSAYNVEEPIIVIGWGFIIAILVGEEAPAFAVSAVVGDNGIVDEFKLSG